MARVVAAAVYGYWSAATSSPSARAASSTRDRLGGAAPHGLRPAFQVRDLEPWRPDRPRERRRSTRRATSNRPSHSFRMCVAYRPPRRGGRRDQRLDLRRPAHASPGRRSGRSTARRPPHPSPPRPRSPSRPAGHWWAARASAPMTAAADRAVADEERDIRPERLFRNAVEVLGERAPARDQAARLAATARRVSRPSRRDRRERVAAVAGQLGRVALVQVAGQRAVEEQRPVGVPVRVDEPRRDDASARRRGPSRCRPRRPPTGPDGEDPVAEDADVGAHDRGSRCRRSRSRRGAAGRSRSCGDGDRSAARTAARPLLNSAFRGAIAQLEEHLHGMQGVRGSSPRSSTTRDETAEPSPLAGAAGGDPSPRTT